MSDHTLSLKEAAERARVSPATLRRVPRTLEDAASVTGLEPELIERFWTSMGLPASGLERVSDDDVQALQYAASVLAAGFPLVAFLRREVNLAARVVARARGGEVLVTGAVFERVSESEHLAFEGVGQVKMKGFDEPVQLCQATMPR